MKSVAFLLLVAVATSYAEVTPCCYPKAYMISSGTQAGLSHRGRGTGYSITSTSAVDYGTMMVGDIGIFYDEDGTPYDFQSIKDYATGVEYKIDPKNKKCEADELEGEMYKCVGENASYAYSGYLGNDALTIDTFGYFFSYPGVVVGQQSVGVSKGDCIPVSYSFSGSLGGRKDRTDILTVTGFSDYKDSITDPDKYFKVPSYCPSLNKAKSQSSQMWEMLRYRNFQMKL